MVFRRCKRAFERPRRLPSSGFCMIIKSILLEKVSVEKLLRRCADGKAGPEQCCASLFTNGAPSWNSSSLCSPSALCDHVCVKNLEVFPIEIARKALPCCICLKHINSSFRRLNRLTGKVTEPFADPGLDHRPAEKPLLCFEQGRRFLDRL